MPRQVGLKTIDLVNINNNQCVSLIERINIWDFKIKSLIEFCIELVQSRDHPSYGKQNCVKFVH